jgi:hypothetical protein
MNGSLQMYFRFLLNHTKEPSCVVEITKAKGWWKTQNKKFFSNAWKAFALNYQG